MNDDLQKTLATLGIECAVAISVGQRGRSGTGIAHTARSPIDGSILAEFQLAAPNQVCELVDSACESFLAWRLVPPPARGEFVRRFGEVLRRHKTELARVVTWESGKIYQESLGEVQEMIDI